LVGKEFYERVVELESACFSSKVILENAIQTNGTLLDEEWIQLFKRHGFQAAISLDGPADIHDKRRITAGGKGTHDCIVRNLELLRSQDYPIRFLAVVTPEAVRRGREIYQYFRQLGCKWMDFLYPICNEVASTFDRPMDPAALGQFFCDVFDAWIEEGDPGVHVRTLNDWCTRLLGGHTITCHTKTDCSYVVTVDTDGSILVCDDLMAFVDSRLGHIEDHGLELIEKHRFLTRLADPEVLFCKECSGCGFFEVCGGGCSLFRVTGKDKFGGPNIFCLTQKKAIRHIRNSLLDMGTTVSPLLPRPE